MVRAADNDGDPGELRDAGDVRALPRREGAHLRQKLPDSEGRHAKDCGKVGGTRDFIPQ
jgi:hypothetical protein